MSKSSATRGAGLPSARVLWAAVEHAPIGVGVCDEDGVFLFANDCLSQLLDRGRQDIIGRPFLAFVHPGDRAASLASYFRSLVAAADPQRRSSAEHGELRALTSRGVTVWLAVTWTVSAPDPQGGQLAVIHLADITVRKRLEADLAALDRRLRHLACGGYQRPH